MHDDLPRDLRSKLDAFLAKKPDAQELVDRLLKKRETGSPAERVQVEKMLRMIVQPSRAGWWLAGLTGVFVVVVLGHQIWSASSTASALARSNPAVALVKRMESGNCLTSSRGERCLRLELEVHREGAEPYTASLTHSIGLEWMSRVQPGSWLTVGVDPQNPEAVVFDEPALAVAAPTPPAGR